jgi:glycerate 2-kinase
MKLENLARDIFAQTLEAIEVGTVVRRSLQLEGERLRVVDEAVELTEFASVVVIAIGKAALPMAEAAAEILGERITAGLIATNEHADEWPAGFRLFTGGHPLPNEGSLAAAGAAIDLLRQVDDERTLVLFLISGGGSALFERPIADSLTLEDLQAVNRTLVGCGAVIGEMNLVRRALSAVKGGRLAAVAGRARQISLIVSDVNHDDLSTVSSGPTLPGEFSRADFDRIVTRYDLLAKFPPRVAALISSGALPEMPPAAPHAGRTHHLILDNRVALRLAAGVAAAHESCVVEIADDLVEGDVEAMARIHLERLAALHAAHPGKTVCLLSGGEVICPVHGDGQGGRNQEFVLRIAINSCLAEFVVLSAGTDGIDGQSPAAGAIADQTTLARGHAHGLDPADFLRRSDSFHYFARLGDAIVTGPTGNNVRDLRILLAR